MIPVDQTIFDNKRGNCYAACIASIFELSLEFVPSPNGNDDDFWPIYHSWFEKGNARVVTLTRGEWVPPESYLIGTVKSPRFENTDHAVVIYGGKVVHDPHPSKQSIAEDISKVTHVDFIFPIDPSKPIRFEQVQL